MKNVERGVDVNEGVGGVVDEKGKGGEG